MDNRSLKFSTSIRSMLISIRLMYIPQNNMYSLNFNKNCSFPGYVKSENLLDDELWQWSNTFHMLSFKSYIL